MQHNHAARWIERTVVELGNEEPALGGAQELPRISGTRQELEVVGSRQGQLVAVAPKTGSRQQVLRPRGVLRIRDRLIHSAIANQPAAHHGLAFIVGRPVDALGRPARVVEHVEPACEALAPACRIGPAAAPRAVEEVGFEGMRDGLVQHHGRRSRREQERASTGRGRRRLARPEATDQGARHALGRCRREVRGQLSEATPRRIHLQAVEDFALRCRHPARPHDLEVATVPAHGEAQRKGDVMAPDGALELAGKSTQTRHRNRRRRTHHEVRLDQRRGLRAGDLAERLEESEPGDLIATGKPGAIPAHQTHRQALFPPDREATPGLGCRPFGVDATLEVDLGEVPRLRGDGRKEPRDRRCLEPCPGHRGDCRTATTVPLTLECPGKPAMSLPRAAQAPFRETLLGTLLETLTPRLRADGGAFAQPGDTEPSVDATVWLALALRLVGDPDVERSRTVGEAVARLQSADGRVSVSPLHPGAYGPTAVAILAWHGRPEFAAARQDALAFLLAHTGDHFPRSPTSPIEMDTNLRGWPWIDRTYSWAEPTALALLALESAGEGEHPRAREGRALLLDRQIASGGWNYGNSRVFGAILRPAPESTGLVLAALAGRASTTAVAASLAYLERVGPALRTPLALGWTCLARAAWRSASEPPEDRADSDAPDETARAIRETLARQSRYGTYETADLALLAIAASSPQGLLAALGARA